MAGKVTYQGKVSIKSKLFRALWGVVYVLLFRPFRTKLFNSWRLLLLKVFGADVQWDSGVYATCKIWAPWNLKMGHNAWLGPDSNCYNMTTIILDDDVTISQEVYLCASSHDTSEFNTADASLVVAPIHIHAKAWVGTRAFIGMGVELGQGAIVGATASVYKDVERMTIVGGNPAQFIKKRVIKD